MPIFDLFSKRLKKSRGEYPDVYVYDKIPKKLKVQIVHIIKDCFGRDHYGSNHAGKAFEFTHDTLCREYGLFQLQEHANSHFEATYNYFLNCENYEQLLDIIELSFRVINKYFRDQSYQYHTETKIAPDDAIIELNGRFKEHGIGYQFVSGELIRVDSTIIHSEVVKPVLHVLGNNKIYKGVNEEFLQAHKHYRHSRYKECLNECLKSFESVMKAICDKQKWNYNQNDTSRRLIDICLINNLIPSYIQNQFSSLRSLLESGLPTIRNRLGGHGQGTQETVVDISIASYALHLTATNILFLTEYEKRI